MKTSEEILKDIHAAITLNKNAKAVSNTALTDAMNFIMHNEKELQNRLDAEYKRGLNDAWEIVRKVFDDCNYCAILNVFEYDSTLAVVIRNHNSIEVKTKILAYKEGQEKIHVGDVVESKEDKIKATVLDGDDDWTVFTENGCVEVWSQDNFIKTGESVDVHSVLIK